MLIECSYKCLSCTSSEINCLSCKYEENRYLNLLHFNCECLKGYFEKDSNICQCILIQIYFFFENAFGIVKPAKILQRIALHVRIK